MHENLQLSAIQYSKLISQVLDSVLDAVCVISKGWEIIKYNVNYKSNLLFSRDLNKKT
jgi:hypothetical protein